MQRTTAPAIAPANIATFGELVDVEVPPEPPP